MQISRELNVIGAIGLHTLKSKTFGPKSFGKKTLDRKLSDAFSGISDKKTFRQIRH